MLLPYHPPVLSFAALILLATTTPSTGIAVAVVGPAEPAERLQRELETWLPTQGIPVAPTAAWSLALTPTPAPLAIAADNAAFDARIKEVAAAFYDGKMEAAGTKLEAAVKSLRPFSSTQTPQLQTAFLWEATLALSRNDDGDARAAIRRLLLVTPEAKVDLDVFPPTVEALRVEMHAKLKPVTVQIAGNPAGVEITAEGVPVSASFGMPPGGKEVEVRVPGLHPVHLSLAEGARSISLAPPPALVTDPGMLAAMVNDRIPGPLMQKIHSASGAGWVVVVVLDPATRKVKPVFWTATSAATIAGRDYDLNDSSLAQWVLDQVRPPRAVAVAPPHPPSTPVAVAGPDGEGWKLDASLGGGVAYLQSTLSGSASAGSKPSQINLKIPLYGVAPELAAQAVRDQVVLSAGLAGGLFEGSDITYGHPQQGTVPGNPPAGGGSFLGARIRGEWAVRSGTDPERWQILPGLSAFYQSYQVDDPGGVLAGFNRVGLTVGVRGRARLASLAGSPLSLEIGAGLSPSSVTEPGKTSGTSVRAGLSPQGALALRWAGDRWEGALHLDGEEFSETFSGKISIGYDPNLTSVTRTYLLGGAGLTFGRRF